jgi:adenylate cyclase
MSARLGRAPDLDALVESTVSALAELLGYPHSLLALRDEEGDGLYVIASHGYDHQGIGSELCIGEGPIGLAAQHCRPVRVGALQQLTKYGRRVRRSFEEGGSEPAHAIPVPSLPGGQSLVAVPAMALGQMVGVLAVESPEPVAFDETDEQLLTVVATLLATALEANRAQEDDAEVDEPQPTRPPASPSGPIVQIRSFARDGSVFIDGEYLIKGVGGRVLCALLRAHQAEGRVDFTNRELRLDPSLELPEHRSNLESRLILLKRRLDEREAPVRIAKTGRGRFRLDVSGTLRLDHVGAEA